MTGADLINGRAVLEGGKVSITAYYTGIQSNRSLELQMDFNGDQMNYSRRIERIGRMSLLATGTLYK